MGRRANTLSDAIVLNTKLVHPVEAVLSAPSVTTYGLVALLLVLSCRSHNNGGFTHIGRKDAARTILHGVVESMSLWGQPPRIAIRLGTDWAYPWPLEEESAVDMKLGGRR